MPCRHAARALSCWEGCCTETTPALFFFFFFCSRCWNRDMKKKNLSLVLLRHVRAKCFVKLHDFLIFGMPKQVQGKLAIFKNWLKRFSCSVSSSGVCQWKVSQGFPSCREHTQTREGKGKWQWKGLPSYLLYSWGRGRNAALPSTESSAGQNTSCCFPPPYRNEEIYNTFLKGVFVAPVPSQLFHLRSTRPPPALGKHCISGCEALVCI